MRLRCKEHGASYVQGISVFGQANLFIAILTDMLVVLDLLDQVNACFSHQYFLLPRANTWSTVRHVGTEGQSLLCTRLHPLEVPCLELADFPMVSSSGGIVEITAWFAEQASCCFLTSSPRFQLYGGTSKGHASVGPSSPWAPREFRIVGGLHGAQRSATYLCPFLRPVNVALLFLPKSFGAPQRLESRFAHSSTARYRPEASWTCFAITSGKLSSLSLGVKFWLRCPTLDELIHDICWGFAFASRLTQFEVFCPRLMSEGTSFEAGAV